MKILHTVESYSPSIGGMQEVVKRISEHLASNGNKVTVATSYIEDRHAILNGVKIRQFKLGGNSVRGIQGSEKEQKAYVDFVIKGRFDVIVNFAAQQWATDLILDKLDYISAKKVFVPTGFSTLYDKEYAEYFRKMKKWMKNYDMNVFLSNDYRDIDFARKNGITNRVLIPNGASEEEFTSKNKLDIRTKLNIPSSHFLIISVGSHTGVKGHLETMQIFKKAKN